MNLGPNPVNTTFRYLLNQSGTNITLGDNTAVNWNGANVVTRTGAQTISGVKTFTDNITALSFGHAGGIITNIFGNSAYSNNFGNNAEGNNFGDGATSSNSFGGSSTTNNFGQEATTNYFGGGGVSNNFFGGSISNDFGFSSLSNTFGGGATSNGFGTTAYSNDFGSSAGSEGDGGNNFGNNCAGTNRFGLESVYNEFGYDAAVNIFGNSTSVVSTNQFGIGASNTFGGGLFNSGIRLLLPQFNGLSSQAGQFGELRISGSGLYVCTGTTGGWRRTFLLSF